MPPQKVFDTLYTAIGTGLPHTRNTKRKNRKFLRTKIKTYVINIYLYWMYLVSINAGSQKFPRVTPDSDFSNP